MKNVISDIFKFIFSGWTLFFVAVALFVWLIISVGQAGERNREANRAATEANRAATEACYSQGMVLVQSDAGQRCVLPQSLVKVK